MLFTEAQLNNANPMAVLDEATYLDESEALINPATIPVRQIKRLGEGVTMVRFDDVAALAESHNASYIDAMVAIAEASKVDPSRMTVAVDEAEIICNPDIVLELANVVVAPQSDDCLASRYVQECIDLWSQMDDSAESDQALFEALVDDTYLDTFLQEEDQQAAAEPSFTDKAKAKLAGAWNSVKAAPGAAKAELGAAANDYKAAIQTPGVKDKASAVLGAAKQHKAVTAGAVAATAAVLAGANKLFQDYKNHPKSWLGQKIAKLRKIYTNWMEKAAKGGAGIGAKLKQAAAKLLQIIDALMAKMQKMAG